MVGFANLGFFPRKGLSDAKSKPPASTGDERNPLLQPHAAARAIVCHFDQSSGQSWLRTQFFSGLVCFRNSPLLGTLIGERGGFDGDIKSTKVIFVPKIRENLG